MVVPNVDNISLAQFQGLDIERSPSTIEENFLTRATNFIVRGGDLVKRPPFRLSVGQSYKFRSYGSGPSIYVNAPTRALISPPGMAITCGPVEVGAAPVTTFYTTAAFMGRNDNDWFFDTGPAACLAVAGRSEPGADFVTVAKVGVNYYFGGPAGLWKLTPPTTWSQVTLPNATAGVRQVIYFKNRLWIVADGFLGASENEDQKTRLYYSAPANPDSIVGTINIAYNEGLGPLKAIQPYSDRLLCFTDRSVWNLYLSGDIASWTQRLFLRGIGTHNPQSVIEHNGMIYFLNQQGLWKTDGNVLEEVSAPVRKWITSTGFYDLQPTENSIAKYKDILIVRINNGADLAAYTMFLYNLEWDSWSGCVVNDILDHHDLQMAGALNNYMTGVIMQNGEQLVLCGTNGGHLIDFGDPSDGVSPDTYYQDMRDTGTAQHVTYNTEFRTKHFDAGKMPRLKDVLKASVELRGTENGAASSEHTIQGWWYTDSDMTNAVNSRTYSGPETDVTYIYMYDFPGARYSRRFSFHFKETSTGFLKVTEINLEAIVKRDSPENPSA